MSTDAIAGVGTKLYYSTTVGGVYTQVAEVPNIQGPNQTKNTYDVTDLDSTGGYNEFIGGFKNGGEVTLDMFFTHDGYAAMKTIFESASNYFWKIVLPNDEQSIFGFEAPCTALGTQIPADEKVTAPVTLKVSGAPTFIKGSTTTTTTA